MAVVSNTATTFNLPNYRDELFRLTPTDTPFISMMQAPKFARAREFEWQTTALSAADADVAALEGSDPDYSAYDRSNVTNVIQKWQYGWAVTDEKMASTGLFASDSADLDVGNPVTNEIAEQTQNFLGQMARDMEKTMLIGTYQKPSSNALPYKTRGIQSAITTNTLDAGADALTSDDISTLLKTMYDNDATMGRGTLKAFMNSTQKVHFSELFGLAPDDRSRGGVDIQLVETDFCNIEIVLDRHMPQDEIFFLDMSIICPVHLVIPGKGYVYVEELMRTGTARNFQLVGYTGLRYGPEKDHGKITNLSTSL